MNIEKSISIRREPEPRKKSKLRGNRRPIKPKHEKTPTKRNETIHSLLTRTGGRDERRKQRFCYEKGAPTIVFLSAKAHQMWEKLSRLLPKTVFIW